MLPQRNRQHERKIMKFIRIALLTINSFLFVTCTHNVAGNTSKNEVTDIDGNVYKTVTDRNPGMDG